MKREEFTPEQLKAAGKIRSRFSGLYRENQIYGCNAFRMLCSKRNIDYHGADNHTTNVPAKYDLLVVAGKFNLTTSV